MFFLLSAACLSLCSGKLLSLYFLTDLPWPVTWNTHDFPRSQTIAYLPSLQQDSLHIEIGILPDTQTWTLQGIRNH